MTTCTELQGLAEQGDISFVGIIFLNMATTARDKNGATHSIPGISKCQVQWLQMGENHDLGSNRGP